MSATSHNAAASGDSGSTLRAVSSKRPLGGHIIRIYLARVATYDPKLAEEREGFLLSATFGTAGSRGANRRGDGSSGSNRLLEIEGDTIADAVERLARYVRANEPRLLQLALSEGSSHLDEEVQ